MSNGLLLAGVIGLCGPLAACGDHRSLPQTQVAARVNGGEITVHQVQAVLQRRPDLAVDSPEGGARRVLDSLVEQELAAQAARQQGLDKEPDVLQSIETARREVLARAYQDRLAAKSSGASSDEIDRFYDSRPELFSQRRIYMLQDYRVDASSADLERLRVVSRDAKNAKEIDERLSVAGLRFGSRIYAQAAEDMPLSLLRQVSALGAGQSLVVGQPGSARLILLLQVQAAPVERRNAVEAIRAFLLNERRRQEVQQGMKALREAAKVDYVGTFAAAASAPAAPAPAASR